MSFMEGSEFTQDITMSNQVIHMSNQVKLSQAKFNLYSNNSEFFVYGCRILFSQHPDALFEVLSAIMFCVFSVMISCHCVTSLTSVPKQLDMSSKGYKFFLPV